MKSELKAISMSNSITLPANKFTPLEKRRLIEYLEREEKRIKREKNETTHKRKRTNQFGRRIRN